MEIENLMTTTCCPAAIRNLFNNSIPVNQAKRILKFKGIMYRVRARNIAALFCDSFSDETSDAAMTGSGKWILI